ncbi:MAG: 2-octaprenyl-6-methoxyphenyl hydroxylase [Stagnimonas sp.]|nr:2-octaprenyl-6-methoxyphenyl hydroxylase [Stagnimonas sp.]
MTDSCDLAIVGGGLVGASLAVALADTPLRIVLIEAAQPPASAPAWDERCIALNDASRQIFAGIGVWEALVPQVAPITATHISERGRFGVTRFHAAEAGLPALGYNTPMRALGGELMTRVAAQPNLQLRCPERLEGLSLDAGGAELLLASGGTLRAGLLVAADGAGSAVRRLLGYQAELRDYQQTALVTAVRVQRDPAGVAYERFTPEGPFALLPKPGAVDAQGHPCSLIWTLPTERAESLRALPDAEFLALAEDCFGERLGRFRALGRRLPHPLQRSLAEQLTAPGVVFCGNAAQSLHPVAAQGFNLGLRDVATLAASLRVALAAGAPLADPARLAAYVQAREQDRRRTADFTDQLVRLFSNRLPLLRGLRHLGLLALDLTPPLKEAVLRQNLGHRGLAA